MSRIRWNTKLVADEMLKENCILISEYKRGSIRIKYMFEGNEYSVRWDDWKNKTRPSRPHLTGGNRKTKPHKKWTNETVNELLKQDGCELADEYKSTKQRIRYKYNNSYYWTTIDDWIHHRSRPHLFVNELEQRFREYLEEKNIEFITQKSFEDLKSEKNYRLRFDFYLPQLNLLVEIDDRGHTSDDEQVDNGKLKDLYCIKHQLKLLRIDETTPINEYENALTEMKESDLYVLRYGRLYKNYNGMYKETITSINNE
ncbi:hypothetical protein M9Y10_024756 [Tritrichomonas musculus]|uniref:Restriction endonuclease PvuRts1 I-like N-terminal domain-containing protein n=1 Tax=Tritrichomonas musculus TaxID=1915356 RepID=A0ABR2HDG8_9EUKA